MLKGSRWLLQAAEKLRRFIRAENGAALAFYGWVCGSVLFRMLRKLAEQGLWKFENGTPELKRPKADS